MAEWKPKKVDSAPRGTELKIVDARAVQVMPKTTLEVLGADLSARDYVRSLRQKMSLLARYRADREAEIDIRRISGEITVEIFNAQKVVMLDKIMAGVALEKRATLAEFMGQAVKGDESIRSMLEAAQKEMRNAAEDEAVAIIVEKTRKVVAVQKRCDAGDMTQGDCDALISLYERNAEELLEDKFSRIGQLSQSYQEHFKQALTQYEERSRAVTGRLLSE